jgi:hypothetical protein
MGGLSILGCVGEQWYLTIVGLRDLDVRFGSGWKSRATKYVCAYI